MMVKSPIVPPAARVGHACTVAGLVVGVGGGVARRVGLGQHQVGGRIAEYM